MRLSLSTLPQLAVLAKILCLLMVVMCGAVPAMVRSVSLYSTCSSGNVTVNGRSVRAMVGDEEHAPYQKLTTQSEDFSRKLYIFAEKTQRYICFNKRWKLVGLLKKQRGPMCQFYEEYNGAYLRYRSAVEGTRYLGFNKVGNPMKNPHGRQGCFNFIKYNPHFNITNHNKRLTLSTGGEPRSPAESPAPRKAEPSTRASKNSLPQGPARGPGAHRVRHRHWQARHADSSPRRRPESRLVGVSGKY
ncbi:fibroblast growth factor 17 [Orussus abietinus]|uniref:fibroblast growth factor 17 n=1 Tax=Orussus abietinus TaxID=222816 RepID=UPI0006266730|nr:fibroblast growth factor 17 [Orussus abietinus]